DQGIDRSLLLLHLGEVAPLIFGPSDRWTVLAVICRVKLAAGREVRLPLVPGFVGLAQPARAVAANENARPVIGSGRIVPAFGVHGVTDTTAWPGRQGGNGRTQTRAPRRRCGGYAACYDRAYLRSTSHLRRSAAIGRAHARRLRAIRGCV